MWLYHQLSQRFVSLDFLTLILFHNCGTHLGISQVKSTKQGTKEPSFSSWQTFLHSLAIATGSESFPGGSAVKNLPVMWKTQSLIPGSGRSPGEENGNLLQYSCLGNPPEEPGRLQSRRSQELDMTEQLNNNREWSQRLPSQRVDSWPIN